MQPLVIHRQDCLYQKSCANTARKSTRLPKSFTIVGEVCLQRHRKSLTATMSSWLNNMWRLGSNLYTTQLLFLKNVNAKSKPSAKGGTLDRPSTKRAYQELNESDEALVKERAILVTNQIKLRYGILSHTSHARIGEAYLGAIVEHLQEPAGAQIKKHGSRNK